MFARGGCLVIAVLSRAANAAHRHAHPDRRGVGVLVERLAANLVDNAVRYDHPGGLVHVETGVDNGQSYLSVSNTGSLVPESRVASLFEPFTRLDQWVGNGHGVGLGLSIVSSVVTTHNGRLEARALPDGGLEIAVRFPTSATKGPPAE